MDLRIERTKRSIINAFIELRSQKALEKITVKELSEKALINKATFYSHYCDIYDLSEQLERESIENIITNIPHPESIVSEPKQWTRELAFALTSQNTLTKILFSGSRASILANRLEETLKVKIYSMYPEYEKDPEWDILLSVLIQGCFNACSTHLDKMDNGQLIDIIGNISEQVLLSRLTQ